MKKLLFSLFIIITSLLVAVYYWLAPAKAPSSQAFINGQVLTMDLTSSIVEAVLLEGERIVAIGNNDEITALTTDKTLIHDLAGRTLIPGIVDAHSHFPSSGVTKFATDLNSPPIGNIQSIEQLLSQMKTAVNETKVDKWVFGLGYDDTLLTEQRHPTRQELDSVSSKKPVFVLHISGHMGVANSRALEEMGITKLSPNPAGGVIAKDEQGELTGLLQETAVTDTLNRAVAYSKLDTLKIIRHASQEYISMGVTTAQNGNANQQILSGLHLASKFNLTPLRLEVWPSYNQLGNALLSGELDRADYASNKFRLGAVKIIADGSIQGYTGLLTEPYIIPPSSPAPEGLNQSGEYVGYPNLSLDELSDLVSKHRANGSKLAIHGNGDAAIDNILAAVKQSYSSTPQDDERIVLIHAQMARDDQLDKMQELGITPSFFSAHTYYWGDRHRDIFLGPKRAERISPTRTSIEKGLRFSVHLDSPIVPMNPMLLIWSTVNRYSTSGKTIGAEQRITPMQALRATTIDAAWQIFRDKEIGSIEVGKLADLVILDGDPLSNNDVGEHSIKDIKVEQTFISGVSVFKRESP